MDDKAQQQNSGGNDRQLEQLLSKQRALLAKKLSPNLAANLAVLRELFRNASDFILYPFLLADGHSAAVVYIEGMTDTKELDLHVIAPLKETELKKPLSITALTQRTAISSMQTIDDIQQLVDSISDGNPVLMADGLKQAASFELAAQFGRQTEEPQAETVVRGPREGFVESLRQNTAFLRRRLHTPAFKLKTIHIGRYTKTAVAIAFIEGIADPGLIEEMENRLGRIENDGIIDSNGIEEWIEDDPMSLFPQLQATERPDVVAAALLEGRVALLIDGTPFSLIAPVTLAMMLQSPEDYYQRSFVSTGIRWLRLLNVFIALFMPSIYVAVLSFHQEMIPTTLLLTISRSREQIPFPALFEALLMEITFEALREAGIRLPKQVGAAVSIVGALVIGQAAISAGIVSSPMVMVVAITGVASFLIPNYSFSLALRLIRFPIMFCAGILGLYGVVLGGLLVLIHLLSLRSFGVPYMSPLAPMEWDQLKDTLIRAPRRAMTTRPHFTGTLWNKFRFRTPYNRLKKE
ncbi:spore germination protein [Paenibacillus sp. NPDC058071]|uniref:spore germination protein n=1 Tax=Paenibacillus sp. NPDC058071 TaxID=3346326 RepID=UPI0036D88CD6